MTPRKRKVGNKDLPTGLYKTKKREQIRFRYRFPNGKEIWFPTGTVEFEAVEAATIFNKNHRNPSIKLLMEYDPYNKPLKQWLKIVKERVLKEEFEKEMISQRIFDTFNSDLVKLENMHGNIMSKSITLAHVNEFLNMITKGKSNHVYNNKIGFLKKVFSYIRDESGMLFNPAESKKRKPKENKLRTRLSTEAYTQILNAAPQWLNIAMRLSLQTTHAVNEISIAKYKDCQWFDKPINDNGLLVYGVLKIHRQKIKKQTASRVEIPITQKIKAIIDDSKKGFVASPYIVHHLMKRSKGKAKNLTHITQLTPEYISRSFSILRDELGVCSDMIKEKRPTFHEIRALSIYLYGENGINAQERAAHSDAKTTEIYLRDHVEWVKIQAAELSL